MGSRKLLSQWFQVALFGDPCSLEMPWLGQGGTEVRRGENGLKRSLKATAAFPVPESYLALFLPALSRPCPNSQQLLVPWDPASTEVSAGCFGPGPWPLRKNRSQRQTLGPKGVLVCPSLSGPDRPQEASEEAVLPRTDVSSDSWLRADSSWPAPGTSVFLNTHHMQESSGWSLESS